MASERHFLGETGEQPEEGADDGERSLGEEDSRATAASAIYCAQARTADPQVVQTGELLGKDGEADLLRPAAPHSTHGRAS